MSPEKMPVGGGGGLGRAAYSASNSRCRSFIISNSSGVNVRAGLFGGETGSSAFAAVTTAKLNPRISNEAPTQDNCRLAATGGAVTANLLRFSTSATRSCFEGTMRKKENHSPKRARGDFSIYMRALSPRSAFYHPNVEAWEA